MDKFRFYPLSFLPIALSFIALSLIFIPQARAADVCSFIRVLGNVNLLKGGKNPAIAAKPQLGAEMGDGVHTRESSKAQLHFVDNTEMFIAPKSEILIDSHLYNPNKKWKVVPNIIQGLIHIMVNLTDEMDRPSFFKTNTVIASVRGTELYILKGPNFTDVFVKSGNVSCTSILPDKPSAEDFHLLRQIEVRGGGGSGLRGLVGFGTVIGRGCAQLGPQTACRFVAGLPPSEVMKIPLEYFNRLDKLVASGLPDQLGESNNPKQLLDVIVPSSYLP